MSDQEANYLQELLEDESICRSMLHLSTAAHHPSASFAAAHNSSAKRQSHFSPSSFQEPSPKRAAIHPPSSPSTSTAAANHPLLGFTKLPLPQPFPAAMPPPQGHLYRTFSAPIYSAGALVAAGPSLQLPEFPTSPGPILTQTPQEFPNKDTVQDPPPFSLHRTVSDPSPVSSCQVAAAGGTPPTGRPPARSLSRSPSCGESPSTKRLKRMKERMREMSKWWNEVVLEGEEEDSEPENYTTDNTPKDESEIEMENPSQEAVWVEKNGDCIILHFKCPCGNGYQILLSGKNCYYKLTNF